MSALLFFLSRYPEQQQKLTTEIRNTFACKDDIVSGAKLNSCSYLFACIQETLRICPPTAGVPWREVESRGMTVDGDYLDEGIDVGMYVGLVYWKARGLLTSIDASTQFTIARNISRNHNDSYRSAGWLVKCQRAL